MIGTFYGEVRPNCRFVWSFLSTDDPLAYDNSQKEEFKVLGQR